LGRDMLAGDFGASSIARVLPALGLSEDKGGRSALIAGRVSSGPATWEGLVTSDDPDCEV